MQYIDRALRPEFCLHITDIFLCLPITAQEGGSLSEWAEQFGHQRQSQSYLVKNIPKSVLPTYMNDTTQTLNFGKLRMKFSVCSDDSARLKGQVKGFKVGGLCRQSRVLSLGHLTGNAHLSSRNDSLRSLQRSGKRLGQTEAVQLHQQLLRSERAVASIVLDFLTCGLKLRIEHYL